METDTYTEDTPNLLKDFAKARRLMKHSSRGKNPDWYRRVIDLDCQLHLFASLSGYRSFLKTSSEEEWQEITQIPSSAGEEFLSQFVDEIRNSYLPRGARSLGVILHLNSDASVFEFPLQDWEAEYNGQTLEQLIIDDPGTVLQDRTLTGEGMSLRTYPVPASPQASTSGVAIASNRQGEELLTEFRKLGNEIDFPIQTHALHSPLLLLSRLPRTFGPQESAFCTLLRYESFSFCGFFNASGELVLLRSLKHVQNEFPQNLETVLATTAASVEISEMVVKAFDCRSIKQNPLEDDLSKLLFQLPFQVFLPPNGSEIFLPIELIVFDVSDDNSGLGFAETETFGTTLSQGFHLQDFLPPSAVETNAFPGALDMKILRMGRVVSRLGVAACVLFGAFAIFSSMMKMSSKEWKSNASKEQESTKLMAQLKKLENTEKLLGGRSKGWESMELYSRLFPLDGSIQFSSANYLVSTASGTTKRAGGKGFSRTWQVSGRAIDSANKTLGHIDTEEGMAEVFKIVKDETGSSAMDMSKKTRNLTVNLDLSENPNFNPTAPKGTEQSFAYTFKLDITQRIEAGDPLAIPSRKL